MAVASERIRQVSPELLRFHESTVLSGAAGNPVERWELAWAGPSEHERVLLDPGIAVPADDVSPLPDVGWPNRPFDVRLADDVVVRTCPRSVYAIGSANPVLCLLGRRRAALFELPPTASAVALLDAVRCGCAWRDALAGLDAVLPAGSRTASTWLRSLVRFEVLKVDPPLSIVTVDDSVSRTTEVGVVWRGNDGSGGVIGSTVTGRLEELNRAAWTIWLKVVEGRPRCERGASDSALVRGWVDRGFLTAARAENG